MVKPEPIDTTTEEFFDRGYLMHLVGGSDSREEFCNMQKACITVLGEVKGYM